MNILEGFKERKKNFLRKENIFFLLLIGTIFFIDRTSKIEIINNYNENIYYINSFINLNLIWNIGVGFGLLSTESSIYYNLVTTLIGAFILILIYINAASEKIDKLIFSLIIGGALGNFYDRLIYKAVPDFIDLHLNNFHWFTFNVADIFISVGIIAFIFRGFSVKNIKNE